MHYVYILKLVNGDYYIGKSSNLERRIKEHKEGLSPTTKRFLPVKLVCYISFDSPDKAKKFETYLKTGSGFAFRNKHLI